MLEIKDNLTVFMSPLQKVNDRTIYFCDIIVTVIKSEIKKNKNGQEYKTHKEREVELFGECYTKNSIESGKKFFWNQLKHKVKLTRTKKVEEHIHLVKIILKKELGCSIYK